MKGKSLSCVLLTFLCLASVSNNHHALVHAAQEDEDETSSEESLLSLQAIAEALEDAKDVLAYQGPDFADYRQQIQQLEAQYQALEAHQQKVHVKQGIVDQLLRQSNAKMLEGFLNDLQAVLEREQAIRAAIANITATHGDAVGVVESEQDAKKKLSGLIPAGTVTMESFHEKFNTQELLKDSEQELAKWASKIIKEELAAYQKSIQLEETKQQVKAHEQAVVASASSSDDDSSTVTTPSCVSIADSAQTVETALMHFSQDDIGMVDYAAQGATIVYDMTSPSYTPPPSDAERLGTVWWRKFIPQDWEQMLLPAGWEDWSVSMIIPSSLYHTFSLKGSTVPAEAVLQSNRNPGACWPMMHQGGSGGGLGQVTLRLATPVDISAFTVDHVSRLQVPSGKTSSAPKEIRVIGYPSCSVGSGEASCPFGFDAQDPIDITYLNYNIKGPAIQTFSVGGGGGGSSTTPDEDEDDVDDEYPEAMDDQSCSATATSCSAPPQSYENIAAVTFQVVQNWGHPDFTCIYRLRVHGEPSKVVSS